MKRPVFLVGCPRSGTTLLYSMLVAAGGFALYRKETFVYDLAPRFPTLTAAGARRRFIDQYLEGYLGKVPGLDVEPFVRAAAGESRDPGAFLPRLMTALARAQGVDRWVEATPIHVLYMNEIAHAVPDALFVHVIRDGRDCAISTERQGWVHTLPWDRSRRVGIAALYWEWIVRAGRAYGRNNPACYREVRFERLIADPRGTLDELGEFLEHDLDYDRIVRNPVHALKKPNTSFRDERNRPDFNPVRRWEHQCTPDDTWFCEELVGPFLEDLGYARSCPAQRTARAALTRILYLSYFSAKHILKVHTPLGRVMTSTRAWSEQPKAGEEPLRQPTAAPLAPSRVEYAPMTER